MAKDYKRELKALVQLNSYQLAINDMPFDIKYCEFIQYGLNQLSDIAASRVCLYFTDHPVGNHVSDTCSRCKYYESADLEHKPECLLFNTAGIKVIPIQTVHRKYGYIACQLTQDSSENVLAGILNFANLVATSIENHLQTTELEAIKLEHSRLKNQLKNMVKVSTLQLEESSSELSAVKVVAEEHADQHKFLFDNMSQGVVYHDSTGAIILANAAATRILGLTPDQLRGTTSLDPRWRSIHDDGSEYPGSQHPVMLTLKNGQAVRDSVMGVYVPEEDTYRWININSIPRFRNNQLYQVVVTFEDITQLTNAKKAAKENYELLRNLAAQVPGVVYQYRLHPDGRSAFPYSSPGMQDIYEVSSEEVRTDATPVFSRLHPDDYDAVVASITKSARDQTEYQIEFKVLLPRQGLRWRSCHAMPELLPDGSTMWHGIIMDITDRKKVEEALKANEEFQRAMIACSPVALYSIDLEGRVLSWNESAQRIFGWSATEVIGTLLPIIPEDYIDEFRASIAAKLRATSLLSQELLRKHKDGRLIPISLSIAPILDNNGKIVGVMGAAEDISQRKKVEAELLKYQQQLETMVDDRTAALKTSNAELEAFSYSVSHDLRAPLRAINGFSGYLEQEYALKLDEEGRRYIRVIRENATKMNRLITDILELSRLSRAGLKFMNLDMRALARSMYQEIASEEEKAAFVFECAELPPALGDASGIKQVWTNLLGNALKYSGRSPIKKIQIGFQLSDTMVTYTVQDYGSGFDPRYADKLFGVFQRLHKESEFDGTGVGLAIVKRIIEKHGGTVSGSGEPEHGASFSFSLPKA